MMLDSRTDNLNRIVEQRPSNMQHSREKNSEKPIILDSSDLDALIL